MKKVLVAMLGMFLLTIQPGGGICQFMSTIIGEGATESFLYPIYGGMIILSGLIVGCTVVILEEIKTIKEGKTEKEKKQTIRNFVVRTDEIQRILDKLNCRDKNEK